MDRVRIGTVAQFCRGVSYKKEQARKTNADGFIAILRANNIEANRLNFDDLVYVPADFVQENQYINSGDIIITMSSGSKAHVGKVAIAQKGLNSSFGAFCGKLIPKDVLPKYLYYTLQSNSFRKHIERQCKGTNINNIRQSYILDYEIDLPSIAEQERIVICIEELFSQLDASIGELKTAKERLKVYRQAVLKDAFDSIRDVCKTTTIQSVCEDIKVGIVIKPTQYYVDSGGVRAFRNANVRRDFIEDNDWAMISKDGHEKNKRSEVHTGDVLIARSGVNLGMAAAVPERFDGYNAIDVVIAVPKQERILSKYLAYYTNSPYGINSVKENQRGVAQGHLNVKVYGKLPLMVHALEHQKQVVSKIEEQLSVCDGIEKTVDNALRQAEALRQSILKKAFEGGLT